MEQKICPLCNKPLSLQQVNFVVAVYICDNLKCSYPVGHDCIIVERNLEDADKTVEIVDKTEGNLNGWIDEVMNKNNINISSEVADSLLSTAEVSTGGWLDDLNKLDNICFDTNETSSIDLDKITNISQSNTTNIVDSDFDDILNFMFHNA